MSALRHGANVAAKRKQQGDQRRCARPGCGFKPVSEFPRNKALADGLGAYCRACKRITDREQRRPARAAEPKAETAKNLSLPARPPGPATTITDDLIARICEPLRLGHSRRVAARRAGVNEDTLGVWMLRGREGKEGDAPTRRLYEAVLAAEGDGLLLLEQRAIAGTEVDHVQALRILERRDPETWAKREVKPAGEESSGLDADELRKLITERLTKYIELPAAEPAEKDPPP